MIEINMAFWSGLAAVNAALGLVYIIFCGMCTYPDFPPKKFFAFYMIVGNIIGLENAGYINLVTFT